MLPPDLAGDAERISRRTRELRAERGWTLDQAADRCGISKSHIWEVENGRQRNPTIRLVRCLADGFGVPLMAFLDEIYSPRLHPTAMAIATQVDAAIRSATTNGQ